MPKTFVVYGGTGGVGSATARLLHARGDQVHLVAREQSKLQALASELGATYTCGDALEPETFTQAAADAGEAIAGVVYAVGSINLRSISRLEPSDFLRDFQLNALGAALAVKAALPGLKKYGAGASVVLFSSVAASQGFTFHASVGMAKAAVSGLTVSLAAELAPKIRVNAVAPSLTQTTMAAGLLSSESVAKALAAKHPLGRLGQAEDIAHMTAFLLSDQASWITGQVFGVDGGRGTLRTQD